jgi:N-dimethylarginine dimethylaminohydrolase
MCPPDYYGIHYEINPWMDTRRPADQALAVRQWNGLRTLLEELGAEISLVEPVEGLPDMVFTANAAVVRGQIAVPARFRHAQRQGEQPHYQKWFADNGYEIQQLPGDGSFEGAGDALFCGDTLWAGYQTRSDALTQQHLGELLKCRVMPLELVDDRFYHLDTCFCPLAPGVAMVFLGAFDDYGRRVLTESVEQLVPVAEDEARSFACNAVVIGRDVVTNTGCDALHEALRAAGYEPHATELSEFVKAGGSAKCLTLRLDGEEAADRSEVKRARSL